MGIGRYTENVMINTAEKDRYHPIAGKQVTEEELNSYEKANIDLLVKIEKEVQAAMPDEA